MPDADTAGRTWSDMLGSWAIPDELEHSAPESPYFFDPAVFVAAADEAIGRASDSPSDEVARAAVPAGGTILDVGAGAGAASLRLAPPAGHVMAVDTSEELLDAFAARAASAGVSHEELLGRWPEVAARAPRADVVVCHHVLYNVPGLAAFATALTEHAAHRVVVELTAVHPLAWLTPYWRALHGIEQPVRPVADDALAVLVALGLPVHERRWRKALQMIGESDDHAVARIARRLCLPRERHDELRAALAVDPPPTERDVVTLWWDVAPVA